MSAARSTGSTAVYGDLTASLFFASRAEITIDRPVEHVWSVLVDLSFSTLKLWNPDVVSVKHISGVAGEEDEFVLMTKSGSMPPLYMRTIRMVPNRQRVLRTNAIDGSRCGFIDHSLYASNRRTSVVYNGYIERRRIPADEVKAFDRKRAAEDMMDYLNHAFELFKKAVEERSPAI